MPLVFVHGVNVRLGEVYSHEAAFRDRHFVEIFYKQLGLHVGTESILNPYWGDLGASISPDTPFLPKGNYEMLWRKQLENPRADNEALLEREDLVDLNSQTPLLDMARTSSLSEVIDVLWELADQEAQKSGNACQQSQDDMARLAQRALAFSHSPEGEQWLTSITTDEQLVEKLGSLLSEKLENKTTSSSTLSGLKAIKSARSRFKNAFSRTKENILSGSKSLRTHLHEDIVSLRHLLRKRAVGTTAKLFNDPMRMIFHQQCALLIGDAFAYFSDRGDNQKASPMAERVMEDLRKAQAIKEQTGEELIVIGHSMGGVILCDIVTCYGKDIPIDILITVGSQFPLFADLQMFPGIKEKKYPIPKPDNVKRWINIFDPHDFLGYPASHIFEGIDDYHLPTYAIGASAHTNYFNRRSFYFQLARRLMDYVSVSTSK